MTRQMRYRATICPLVVVLLVAVWPRAARAQVGETVVVPIGKGVALGPTARVAKELCSA